MQKPIKLWLAKLGGETAKIAKEDLETKLKETIISKDNFLLYNYEPYRKKLDKAPDKK